MNARRLYLSLALSLMLALATGLVLAQEAATPGDPGMPLGTGFTYQGRLTDLSGHPVDSTCDFQFTLWDDPDTGMQVGPLLAPAGVLVTGGLFTVQLDFGDIFDGTALWLEIAVRCAGDPGYTDLSPRQPLTAAPSALYAATAPWSGLTGVPPGFADNVDDDTTYTAGAGLVLTGTIFAADVGYLDGRYSLTGHTHPGSDITSPVAEAINATWATTATYALAAGDADTLDGQHAGAFAPASHDHGDIYWSLSGNTGTTPGTHFLGTTDPVSLTLAVSGTAALRLYPNTSSPNLVGGYSGNRVTPGMEGATIGGGGAPPVGGTPGANRVTYAFGTVSGGVANIAGGWAATVGGGDFNEASYQWATVGGGAGNKAIGLAATVCGGDWGTASGQRSAVCGGWFNTASGDFSAVGGGFRNIASAENATVGGGYYNDVSAESATVGGGEGNAASGWWSTVGGGAGNTSSNMYTTVGGGETNTASGDGATVPGGSSNTAQGNYSFAAGRRARAMHQGAFVWADSTSADFASTAADQFLVRATGGVSFTTGAAAFQINGYTAWHAGNDGPSSGLDADLLDGQHANAFAPVSHSHDAFYWSLGGNAGTIPGAHFLGTTDPVSLTLAVSGTAALRLYPTADSPNLVGGYFGNWVAADAQGATIGGGGDSTAVNRVTSAWGTVAGGIGNEAGFLATVGGGWGNTAGPGNAAVCGGGGNTASGQFSTIAGGSGNSALDIYASVGGGQVNTASGVGATIAGGAVNVAGGSWWATIGGGYQNVASGEAATVAGGRGNTASDEECSVGGGHYNQATGDGSTVAGGYTNTASGWYTAIGGGLNNVASGSRATVSGGEGNTSSNMYTTVGGGETNTAGGAYATVGGGNENGAYFNYGTIGGGQSNRSGGYATVGGGALNEASNGTANGYATIGGGMHNIATGFYATIGGGNNNTATNPYATVCGGDQNQAIGERATVGGGIFNQATGYASTVAGGDTNHATGQRATIGGGAYSTANGSEATIAGGIWHQASGDYATVGGGYSNTSDGPGTTVGGGIGNTARDPVGYATVGGGYHNQAISGAATVAGGYENTANGGDSAIGGGANHVASGAYATIAGGRTNTASDWAAVAGGHQNNASGAYSAIGGGANNAASGQFAVLPGGSDNVAGGTYAFAAGRRAKAVHNGCFVWGDSTDAAVSSSGSDQFIVRANGGLWFGQATVAITPTIGAGVFISTSTGAYLTTGGAWTNASDRNLKENLASVDGGEVLARLAQVPISTWNYRAEDQSVRHMGPTAQDFYAAFGLGNGDRSIGTVDADGVALAAVQGLYAENQALKAQVTDLEARLTALEQTHPVRQVSLSGYLPWLLCGGLVLIGGGVAVRRKRG